MAVYRRRRQPGGTYFFTVCLENRGSTALTDHVAALRQAFCITRSSKPFEIVSIVILPNHLHTVWKMPEDDADFAGRWRMIKGLFSRAVPPGEPRSESRMRRGERGIWQRRYWEHLIQTRSDLKRHVRYCLNDPVRHGLVKRPDEWLFSSVHRDIRHGRNWGTLAPRQSVPFVGEARM